MHPFVRAYQARQTLLTGGTPSGEQRPYYQASQIDATLQRVVVYNASAKTESEPKKKRKSEGSSDTSDHSDNGRCWSDYEAVPGKEPYSEDSCRPKKKKKKEEESEKSTDNKD